MPDGIAADYRIQRESTIPAPLPKVFDFFSKPENLEAITPPWLQFHIDTRGPIEMRAGAKIAYRLKVRGIPLRWLTLIESWNPPFEFVDIQLSGPYKLWRHTHRFAAVGGGTRITDCVEYTLPFGPLGRLVHWAQVRRDVSRIFDLREQQIGKLLG